MEGVGGEVLELSNLHHPVHCDVSGVGERGGRGGEEVEGRERGEREGERQEMKRGEESGGVKKRELRGLHLP